MLVPKPLHDRVLVVRDEPDQEYTSGIKIPELFQKRKRTGTVVASGPGFVNSKGVLVPNTLKPGDKIHFGKYAGTELSVDGKTYIVMREGDIAGVLE